MPSAFWRGGTNGFEKADVRFTRALFSNFTSYECLVILAAASIVISY